MFDQTGKKPFKFTIGKGEVIKGSLRSNEDIDVAALAQIWGGGGHYHAAGFSVADSNVDAVKSMLLREAERVLL